jgi:hypothetical protein
MYVPQVVFERINGLQLDYTHEIDSFFVDIKKHGLTWTIFTGNPLLSPWKVQSYSVRKGQRRNRDILKEGDYDENRESRISFYERLRGLITVSNNHVTLWVFGLSVISVFHQRSSHTTYVDYYYSHVHGTRFNNHYLLFRGAVLRAPGYARIQLDDQGKVCEYRPTF